MAVAERPFGRPSVVARKQSRLGNVEALERRRTHLGRVAHASLCDLDDPLGDSFSDRVVCVGNPEKLQCRFIGRGETFHSFRVELGDSVANRGNSDATRAS